MMQVFSAEQNSEAWTRARLGIPTSSQFSTVLAKGRGGKGDSVTRRTYLNKLAGEILTNQPMDNYSNHHMERGHELEDEARSLYAFLTDTEPEQVGFIRNGDKGCSPDSLIGEDGMLEIKTALPHILIDKIRLDAFPPEHKAQCQGQLWVAERKWVDIAIYWPGLPLFIKRAYRDDAYIRVLCEEVDKFNSELAATVDMVRGYQMKAAA